MRTALLQFFPEHAELQRAHRELLQLFATVSDENTTFYEERVAALNQLDDDRRRHGLVVSELEERLQHQADELTRLRDLKFTAETEVGTQRRLYVQVAAERDHWKQAYDAEVLRRPRQMPWWRVAIQTALLAAFVLLALIATDWWSLRNSQDTAGQTPVQMSAPKVSDAPKSTSPSRSLPQRYSWPASSHAASYRIVLVPGRLVEGGFRQEGEQIVKRTESSHVVLDVPPGLYAWYVWAVDEAGNTVSPPIVSSKVTVTAAQGSG